MVRRRGMGIVVVACNSSSIAHAAAAATATTTTRCEETGSVGSTARMAATATLIVNRLASWLAGGTLCTRQTAGGRHDVAGVLDMPPVGSPQQQRPAR